MREQDISLTGTDDLEVRTHDFSFSQILEESMMSFGMSDNRPVHPALDDLLQGSATSSYINF